LIPVSGFLLFWFFSPAVNLSFGSALSCFPSRPLRPQVQVSITPDPLGTASVSLNSFSQPLSEFFHRNSPHAPWGSWDWPPRVWIYVPSSTFGDLRPGLARRERTRFPRHFFSFFPSPFFPRCCRCIFSPCHSSNYAKTLFFQVFFRVLYCLFPTNQTPSHHPSKMVDLQDVLLFPSTVMFFSFCPISTHSPQSLPPSPPPPF